MQTRRRAGERSFVFELADAAARNIEEGYYDHHNMKGAPSRGAPARASLRGSILGSRFTPLIAEIKFASPSEGVLREAEDVGAIAGAYERAGVSAVSVLTEPRHFKGDIGYLPLVKGAVNVPVLMKDIVIDPLQIEAGADAGADAVLLIAAVFRNGLARASLGEMFSTARRRGVEVLFEAHTEEEYLQALDSAADVVGINNRNLETLEVSLETSKRLLAAGRGRRDELAAASGSRKVVISESGITSRGEMVELAGLGADGFLVGSAIMKSVDLAEKVRSLTGAEQR